MGDTMSHSAEEVARIAKQLTAGAARAVMAMTTEWQFAGKSTFDHNGAWNALNKASSAVERQLMKDGKWSRHAYRLRGELGLAVRQYLTGAGA